MTNIDIPQEPTQYEPGMAKIDQALCPIGEVNYLACMFCVHGHLLECHHPKNCADANCQHWQARIAEDHET